MLAYLLLDDNKWPVESVNIFKFQQYKASNFLHN